MLPPLAVIFVGTLIGYFSLRPGPLAAADAGQAVVSAPPLSSVFTPEVQYWAGELRGWSAEAGLDPNLAATVMQIESCGNPAARSSAGALGLFQVMPYHFSTFEDPYDPATNARRGLAYLEDALSAAEGDARLALAGYNGGLGAISAGELAWAAETERYAYWGSGIYADASGGVGSSPRLEEWLSAGGRGLCTRADQQLGLAP